MARPPPGQMVINMKTTITTHGPHNGVIVQSGIQGAPPRGARGARSNRGDHGPSDIGWPYPSTSQFPLELPSPSQMSETPLQIRTYPSQEAVNRMSRSSSRDRIPSPVYSFGRDSPPEWLTPDKVTLNVFQTGPTEVSRYNGPPPSNTRPPPIPPPRPPSRQLQKRSGDESQLQGRRGIVNVLNGGEGTINDTLQTTTTVEVFRTPIGPGNPARIVLPPGPGQDDIAHLVRTTGPNYERWTNTRNETMINDIPMGNPMNDHPSGGREGQRAVQWKENLVERSSRGSGGEGSRSPVQPSRFPISSPHYSIGHPTTDRFHYSPSARKSPSDVNRMQMNNFYEDDVQEEWRMRTPSTAFSPSSVSFPVKSAQESDWHYANIGREPSPMNDYEPLHGRRSAPRTSSPSYIAPDRHRHEHEMRDRGHRHSERVAPQTNPTVRRRAQSGHRSHHDRNRDRVREYERRQRHRSESPSRILPPPTPDQYSPRRDLPPPSYRQSSPRGRTEYSLKEILPPPTADQYSLREENGYSTIARPREKPEPFHLFETRDALGNVVGQFDPFDMRHYDENMLISPLVESEDSLISEVSPRNDKAKSDRLEEKPAKALNVDDILRTLNRPNGVTRFSEYSEILDEKEPDRFRTTQLKRGDGRTSERERLGEEYPKRGFTQHIAVRPQSNQTNKVLIGNEGTATVNPPEILIPIGRQKCHSSSSSDSEAPPIPLNGPFSPFENPFYREGSSISSYSSMSSNVPRRLHRTRPLEFYQNVNSPKKDVVDHVYDDPNGTSHVYEKIDHGRKELQVAERSTQEVVERPQLLEFASNLIRRTNPILPTDPDISLFEENEMRDKGRERPQKEVHFNEESAKNSVYYYQHGYEEIADEEESDRNDLEVELTLDSREEQKLETALRPSKERRSSEQSTSSDSSSSSSSMSTAICSVSPSHSTKLMTSSSFEPIPQKTVIVTKEPQKTSPPPLVHSTRRAHPDGLQFPKITKSSSLSNIPEKEELRSPTAVTDVGFNLITSTSVAHIPHLPYADESPSDEQMEFRELEEEPKFWASSQTTNNKLQPSSSGTTVVADNHKLIISGFFDF